MDSDSTAEAPPVLETEKEGDVLEQPIQVSTNFSVQGDDDPPAKIHGESTPKTSTPVRQISVARRSDSVNCSPVNLSNAPNEGEITRDSSVRFIDPREVTVPILGYETMTQRSRFTVFKLHVQRGRADNWFVFRRYSDFIQLQRKLWIIFPMFRFGLPPKRWFRDNFDREFLDDRVQGLQAFINSIICHQDVCNSIPVQQFFCFEDPPGAHDSIEESRAYCAELEDTVYGLRKELRDKESELGLLRDELTLYKAQVEMLTKALREKSSSGATNTNVNANTQNTIPSPANSLAECDILTTQVEHSYSISINAGSQMHSVVDPPSAQLGVSVTSLKDELLAATGKDSLFAGNQQ